jgi:hypothetical protein
MTAPQGFKLAAPPTDIEVFHGQLLKLMPGECITATRKFLEEAGVVQPITNLDALRLPFPFSYWLNPEYDSVTIQRDSDKGENAQ